MSTFHEELTAARKAKGLTQEQLAEAMHASRSAISHWESGRSSPDYATIKQLSIVLGCTFSVQTIRPDEVNPNPPAASPASELSAAPSAPSGWLKNKRLLALLAALVVIVVAACVVIPLLSQKPDQPASVSNPTLTAIVPPKANSIEWFSFAEQPQNGKPFVAVQFNESPLRVIHDEGFESGLGWIYSVYLTETNGIPFNMTQIETVIFTDEPNPDVFTYDANAISGWFGGQHDIPANGQRIFRGGMPRSDDLLGVGISVTGTDESGEEYVFHAYLPLSQEIHE